jgi:hypothetical protein
LSAREVPQGGLSLPRRNARTRRPGQRYGARRACRKVDQGFLGIPKEGIAFSNDARATLGPPKWSSARFATNGGTTEQRIKMRYMTGAKGPKP